VPANTLSEFIAYAKANPGKLSFGSGGIGTPAHLAGELLKIRAKIDYTHVPFRGTGPALQSVIGNHVPTAFNPPSPLIPHLKAGTIKAIAITTLQRTAALPNTPRAASRASTPRPGTPSSRRPERRRRRWRCSAARCARP
jgi:tripartite-type tricarboxylate transporter receptor subunit TctC